MPLFTKDSLERLKQKIDLIEVLQRHIDLKRSGSSYKALCPFHDEKTPSFVIQRGDSHYHCFGCSAHGDAIHFLMTFLHLTFSEAVEMLAEQFHVPLETTEGDQGASPAHLKEALEIASAFYHFYLMRTQDGMEARQYLLKRNINSDFIRRFEIGLAPLKEGVFQKIMHSKGFSDAILQEAGLLTTHKRDFFRDRICFPIRNASGRIVGFSGRKYKEQTTGGKYINTPETTLFKKSHLLFGLNYCRRRIAKERRVILVEGQIDCLKLIESGLNLAVAALGTAFGESHIKELKSLGVKKTYLLFDGDKAGMAAASKAGDILQKDGFQVFVAVLPDGFDPDLLLNKEGVDAVCKTLEAAEEYLHFQTKYLTMQIDTRTPAGKTEWIKTLVQQIRSWEDPILIHESLKQLAQLAQVPAETLGVSQTPSRFVKRNAPLSSNQIDPNRILELDLLRWLLLVPEFIKTAQFHLDETYFWNPVCRSFFSSFLKNGSNVLNLMMEVDQKEGQDYLQEILEKKVNKERAETLFLQTIQQLLDRQWMQKGEEIKMQIHSGQFSEEEVLKLAKEFDLLKQNRPKAGLVS